MSRKQGDKLIILIGEGSEGEVALAHQVALAFGKKAKRIVSVEELVDTVAHNAIFGVFIDPKVGFLDECYRILYASSASMFAPVIETPSELTKRAMLEGLGRGAVDVVRQSDLPTFAALVRLVCSDGYVDPSPQMVGRVVIGHESPDVRLRLARVFRMAGYETYEASSPDSLRLQCENSLLVVSQEMWFTANLIHRKAQTVILEPNAPVDMPPKVDGASALVAESCAPLQVVLLAEQLAAASTNSTGDSTSSVQLRACTFRRPGKDAIAASIFCMSESTLIVGTLSVPDKESQLWVEMTLPNGEAIHLRGHVRNRCAYTTVLRDTPVGFEVELDKTLCPSPDLELYRRACRQLLGESHAETASSSDAETYRHSSVHRKMSASTDKNAGKSTYCFHRADMQAICETVELAR